jgi:hypothetical protein
VNRKLRQVVPVIYALAVGGGFFIKTQVGVIVAVVGAIVVGLVYTFARGDGAEGSSRRPPRNRNRNRR